MAKEVGMVTYFKMGDKLRAGTKFHLGIIFQNHVFLKNLVAKYSKSPP
jgi:hypothetical protein